LAHKNPDSFKFIKCYDEREIPLELVEQIKEKDYDSKKFYEYTRLNMKNPLVIIQVLRNEDEEDQNVYGFLWAEFDPMSNSIFVHSYSVQKSLWHKGKALKVLADHLRLAKDKLNCRVRWLSNRPMLFEKLGFHKTNSVLFEV